VTVIKDPFKGFLIMLPSLVVTRSISLPVVGERITLFDTLLLLWWLGIVVRMLQNRRSLHFSSTIFAPVFAYYGFIAALLASLFNAISPSKGIVEISVFLLLASFGLATVGIATSKERIESIVEVLTWTFVGVVLISLWEGLLVPIGFPVLFPIRHSSRITGTFRNPNQLGGFLVVVAPFVWALLLLSDTRPRHFLVLILGAVGGTLALVLTSSRASIATAAIQFSMLLPAILLFGKRKHLWRSVRVVLITAAVAVICFISLSNLTSHYWQTFIWRSWPGLKAMATLRFENVVRAAPTSVQAAFLSEQFSVAWQAFLDSPLIGVGIGNFGESYRIDGRLGYEVHSQYAGLLAETGILGLLCFTSFILPTLYRSRMLLRTRQIPTWIAVALLISVSTNLLGGAYVRILRRREFWLILSLIHAYWGLLVAAKWSYVRKLRPHNSG